MQSMNLPFNINIYIYIYIKGKFHTLHQWSCIYLHIYVYIHCQKMHQFLFTQIISEMFAIFGGFKFHHDCNIFFSKSMISYDRIIWVKGLSVVGPIDHASPGLQSVGPMGRRISITKARSRYAFLEPAKPRVVWMRRLTWNVRFDI